MLAQWITKEEYDALGDDTSSTDGSDAVSALKIISGQVLESSAAPYSLMQSDYQGHAIVQDVLTRDAFNEDETCDKTTLYSEGVNSMLTEIAPSVHKTYLQQQSYSETYANKTETVQVQSFVRTTDSDQYIQAQNNFNLNSPHVLQVNAQQQIYETIGTRNAFVGTHSMSGQTYQANYGTLNQSNDLTVLRVKGHCQLGADQLTIGGNGSSVAQPVRPRRVPNIFPKIFYKFISNTIKVIGYNSQYVIQLELNISSDAELDSLNAINPVSLDSDGVSFIAQQILGQYFYGLQLKSGNNFQDMAKLAPTLVIGNQHGNYTLSDGCLFQILPENTFVFQYSNTISASQKPCESWLVTLNGTLDAIVTIKNRSANDNLGTAHEIIQFSQNTRRIINASYDASEFLAELVIKALELIPK